MDHSLAVKHEICEFENKIVGNDNHHDDHHDLRVLKKRKRFGSSELVKLGIDSISSVFSSFDRPRLRDCRNNNGSSNNNKINNINLKRKKTDSNSKKILSVSPTAKRWVRLVSQLQISFMPVKAVILIFVWLNFHYHEL